jgi:hypothetical protein
MPLWTVKVKAYLPEQSIKFEREVEAASKEEAEMKAEEAIDDYEIKDEMCMDFVTYESEAIQK